MKSYLKFLSRNKLYTAIEAVGLAVSLAFVILIGSYVWQQWQVARGYPEWKNIYAVGLTYDCVERAPRGGMAELLKENVPEIEKSSIYSYLGIGGTVGGVPIHDGMIAGANPDFLDLFPIRWVSGNPDALLESHTVALKEQFAREHFPGEDVIGKVWEDNYGETYTVVAVFRDFGSPVFQDDELVFFQIKANEELRQGWTGSTTCFVRSGESEDKLTADIDAVLESHLRNNWNRDETRAMKNGSIERMDRLYFSDLNGNQCLRKGNRSLLRMLSAVVLLLLLSAIFNYINLSTALAGRRAKEMGIRSVLGATKDQIVWGYLKESLLFTAACTVFAVVLAYAFRPLFTHYVDGNASRALAVPFAWHWNFGMVAAILGLALLIGLAAGWIPSRIASRFNAIQVVKGDFRTASKRILSKVFIVFQTGLSILLIALSLVMERQYSHMVHRPLGATVDNLYYQLLVRETGHEDALKALPFVAEMDQANGFPGRPYMTMSMPDKENGGSVSVAFVHCGPEAFRMYGFEVVEDFHAPNGCGYWLSESAFHRFGTDPAEPKMPDVLGEWFQGTVAGVVKDFAVTDAAHVDDALLGILSVDEDLGAHYRVLRIEGDQREAEKELQALYKRFSMEKDGYEGIPGLSGFMKDQLDAKLGEAENYMRLIELFMFLAVMVALLGLLAMSALYASERTHDIAVRKVFGSTVRGETYKAVGEYMLLVGIACLIAVPLAVWLSGKYLEDFNYRISNYGWIFAVAVLIAFVISFASVLWQDLKAAKTNPAIELKKE